MHVDVIIWLAAKSQSLRPFYPQTGWSRPWRPPSLLMRCPPPGRGRPCARSRASLAALAAL